MRDEPGIKAGGNERGEEAIWTRSVFVLLF